MKSLARNSLFNTFYTILNMLFPLVTSAYVSRVLLPDGVGLVAYAQSIVSYFVIFAALGLPNYGLREIAQTKDNKREKNKLFTELIIINFGATVLSFSLYIVLVLCNSFFRGQLNLFFACGTLILFNAINIDWLYQGEEEYVYIVVRSLIVKIASLVCIFLFVKDISDFVYYAWISTFAIGGNYLFNVIHARKYVRLEFYNLNIKQHLLPIFIMAGGVLLSSIYGKIDTTMLGMMVNEKSTGLYTNGQKIIELVITVCTAITTVFMPRLSYYYKYNREEFHKLIDKGIKILSFLTFPMAVGIFIVAPEITVILFGAEFLNATITVRVLCFLIIIKSFGNLLCFQLVMCTGNEKERLPANFFGSLTNLVMNFFLIPIWAENGAAIASVISEFIVNGYQLVKMKKKLNLLFDKKPIVQAIICTLIMALVCIGIHSIECSLYLSAFSTIFAGMSTYIVLNIIIRNEILKSVIDGMKKRVKNS